MVDGHLRIGEFGRGQRLDEGAESDRRKDAEPRENLHVQELYHFTVNWGQTLSPIGFLPDDAHSIPQNQSQLEKFTNM